MTAPSVAQLLNNAASLHPLAAQQSQDLDYLVLDDGKLSDIEGGQSVLPSRGWGDELCYGTGTTYLAGLTAGGLWGLREGLARSRKLGTNPTLNSTLNQAAQAATASTSSALNTAASATSAAAPPAAAQQASTAAASSAAKTAENRATAAVKSPAFRVRLNAVLNSITRRGTFVGNNAGVLALIYNAFNSSIDKYRGKHDIYGSMLAGASTGLIWKSTAGVRPMVIASASMTAGAAAWTVLKPKLL